MTRLVILSRGYRVLSLPFVSGRISEEGMRVG